MDLSFHVFGVDDLDCDCLSLVRYGVPVGSSRPE